MLAFLDRLEPALAQAGRIKGLVSAETDVRALVVNRVPLSEIGERLGVPVLGAIPPAADECLRAQQLGRALIHLLPEALVCQAYREMAQVLA